MVVQNRLFVPIVHDGFHFFSRKTDVFSLSTPSAIDCSTESLNFGLRKRNARVRVHTETGQLLDATSSRIETEIITEEFADDGRDDKKKRETPRRKKKERRSVKKEENNAHHDGSASGTTVPNASYFTIGGVGRRLISDLMMMMVFLLLSRLKYLVTTFLLFFSFIKSSSFFGPKKNKKKMRKKNTKNESPRHQNRWVPTISQTKEARAQKLQHHHHRHRRLPRTTSSGNIRAHRRVLRRRGRGKRDEVQYYQDRNKRWPFTCSEKGCAFFLFVRSWE